MTTQRRETVAEDWGESRSRVVTWHDPAPSTARGLTMAGLDYLRAMIDGTLPPVLTDERLSFAVNQFMD